MDDVDEGYNQIKEKVEELITACLKGSPVLSMNRVKTITVF
jgi:hypothetical protein